MASVLEVQKTCTAQQSKRALADNRLSIYVYDDVLGPKFRAASLPVTNGFFDTLHADARDPFNANEGRMGRVEPAPRQFSGRPIGR